MAFEAAVDSRDITPVAPPYPSLWMGGYGWDPRGNHGAIARDLRAQCLVIWDDGTPKVLLRADLISIPRDVNQFIRDTLDDEGLVARNDLMMLASHTHSGACFGDTRPNPYLLMNLTEADINAVNGTTNIIIDELLDLVRTTLELDRTDVTLSYTEGSANIGYNRSVGDQVLDTVPILRVSTTDDELFAVVFGAAAHPVARGEDEVFDADYPGVASELIESITGVPALFVQGACGDQNAHDPHNDAMVVTLGEKLGQEVVDQLDTADFSPVTGPIATAMIEVDLPLHVDTSDQDVIDELRAKFEARRNSSNPIAVGWRHADLMLKLIDSEELPTHVPMPIQRWRFAGLTILGLAHEPLSSYDLKLKQAFNGDLWVAGYANECEAYVADNTTLRASGYEAGWGDDDDSIAGDGAWTMSYGWPSPLKFSRSRQAAAGTTERIVIDACVNLLNT